MNKVVDKFINQLNELAKEKNVVVSVSSEAREWLAVKGYDPTPSGLRDCVSGAEVILIPAGVPRKPGMTRDGMKRSSKTEGITV